MSYTTALAHICRSGDRNACVPIATSIVTGEPIEKVTAAFAQAGRKPCKGTSWSVWEAANELLGYGLMPVRYRGKTMVSVERWLQRNHPGKQFIVHCTGHAAAFDGQRIDDWSQGSRKRVKGVYKLVPHL
jgi:hypothetical protein